MTAILCCTQADIIARLGGQEKASELLDPNRTGSLDTSVLDLARADASADVEAAVGERYIIWCNSEFPQKVVRLAATIGVYYTHGYGTGWRAVPAEARTAKEDALKELQRIEKGDGSPGSPRPKSRLFPRDIDNSDCGTRAVYDVCRRSGGLIGGR